MVWPTVIGMRQLRRSDGTQEPAELLPIPEASPATAPVAPLLRQLIEDVQLHMTDVATEQLEYMLVELGRVEARILEVLTPRQSHPQLSFDHTDADGEYSVETASEDSAPAPIGTGDGQPFASGDIVAMTLDGRTYSVEVIQVDFDTGTAEVCTAPAMESVTVDISVLSPIESVHEPVDEPSRRLTLFNAGDAVEFELDGEELFGEVIDVDDARNSATVMLIPSQDEVVVCQDDLRRAEPDPLSDREQRTPMVTANVAENAPTLSSPRAGCPPIATAENSATIPVPKPLADVCQFLEQLADGRVSLEELHERFDQFVAARESFVAALTNAYDVSELRVLALRCGDATQDKRRQVVATRVYEALLRRFACDQVVGPSFRGETLAMFVSHHIDRLTVERLEQYARSCRANRETDVPVVRPSPTLF
ncbi:MAG: hypothetical protein ACK5Q5_05525 [Planctomycetaceae bacterium]